MIDTVNTNHLDHYEPCNQRHQEGNRYHGNTVDKIPESFMFYHEGGDGQIPKMIEKKDPAPSHAGIKLSFSLCAKEAEMMGVEN